jgi:two-component system response regulator NreC
MAADLRLAPALDDTRSSQAAGPSVRVVLADDHELMRHSMRTLFDGEEAVDVVAEADELSSAVRHVREQKPDVLVLDLRMPGGSSIQTIGELREQAPDTRVVIVTMEDNPMFAEHALASGALGFVLKDRADEELPQAVCAAARGERYVSPQLAARLDAVRRALADGELTPREVEILRLIALGHTSVEVARMLKISPRTVESHRARIHSKLGLTTRAELVGFALRRGLLGV